MGGKAARLGALAARLPERVPDGFVVTTAAHARLLAHGQTSARLRAVMKGLDLATDATRLGALAAEARDLVLAAPIPEGIAAAIREQASSRGGVRSWAVRSSAVGEDGPFSFAGQFETLLHVPGSELSAAWRRVVASTFSEHVMRYRLACGLFELATPMAVLFMPMVAARSAGVLYTRDPAQPRRDTMLVSALGGLAPDLVGGRADAETAFVSRGTLGVEGRVTPGTGEAEAAPILSDGELARLARLGLEAETVLGPALDVEWAMEDSGCLRLLQARPLASVPASKATAGTPASACLARGGLTIVGGRAVGTAITGVTLAREGSPDGIIFVVPQALPELGHLLARVDGLVAEHGSLTGHLASLAREFGVPSVFGMPDATRRLAGEGGCHSTPPTARSTGERSGPRRRGRPAAGRGSCGLERGARFTASSCISTSRIPRGRPFAQRAAARSTTSCGSVTSGGSRPSSRMPSGERRPPAPGLDVCRERRSRTGRGSSTWAGGWPRDRVTIGSWSPGRSSRVPSGPCGGA